MCDQRTSGNSRISMTPRNSGCGKRAQGEAAADSVTVDPAILVCASRACECWNEAARRSAVFSFRLFRTRDSLSNHRPRKERCIQRIQAFLFAVHIGNTNSGGTKSPPSMSNVFPLKFVLSLATKFRHEGCLVHTQFSICSKKKEVTT
jgi:hypothetical protein